MDVTIVIGRICSGKTHISNLLHKDGKILVEVGGIVRSLTKTQERVFDKSLDEKIMEEIDKILVNDNSYLIVGIRQLSILKHLLKYQPKVILVEVTDEKRMDRYNQRSSGKDKLLTFEEADELDDSLGLGKLIEFIKFKNYTQHLIS